MPFLFRAIRRDSVTTGRIRQYCWYAIGEVVLIFVGITLALAFEDWSQERQLRGQELASLEDIAENLRANIITLTADLQRDSTRMENCWRGILLVEEQSVWQPESGELFDDCRYWTSPYLQFAAYDSLKARGTDLLSSRSVRTSIVRLYEGTYADHIGDVDRSQWDFQSAVVLPVWNRYLRTMPDGNTEPSNYDALLASEEFLNVLYNRNELLSASIDSQNASLENTQEVLAAIEDEIGRQEAN
jgi:hypothetical protein